MSNKLKKIGIKNLTYYFFDSMININLDSKISRQMKSHTEIFLFN